jgi:hypothetical protein
MNIFDAITLFCAFIMILLIVQMIRLHFLSKLISQAINDTFERRMSTIGTTDDPYKIPYPDIDATYNGLKWYKPWERPSTLLVFKD